MPRVKHPKTKKSILKRFKITARGKILRFRAGRRHLMQSKSGNRRRNLGKPAVVHKTDAYRITQLLPFSHRR
jgi:large subunit ribosomal protein L35